MGDIIGASKLTTTSQRLYIVEKSPPFERMEVQFVPQISESRTADIQEVKILSQDTPRYQYTGGSERVRMNLDFYAVDELKREAEAKAQWLKSLTMRGTGEYRQVLLSFGELFRDQIYLVKSVSIDRDMLDDRNGFLPIVVKCKVEFILDQKANRRIEDVRL